MSASTARYVSGDTKPRIMKASASYPFEKGDLLYEHPADHTLRRASQLNAEGTAELGQLALAQYFAGVAGVKNALESGEVSFKLNQNFESEVVVHTGGVWEFDCPAQNFTNGQGVGVYATATGVCSDQKVDSLKGSAALTQRIGSAVLTAGAIKAASNSQTMNRVQVDIAPALFRSGVGAAGTYTGASGQ